MGSIPVFSIKLGDDAVSHTEQHSNRILDDLTTRVHQLMKALVGCLGPYTGYCVGPALSLVGAVVVRFSLGKRVPTSSPFYIAGFVGVVILVTYLANWFFKQYQPRIQKKGVMGALFEVVTPSPQKIIPYYACSLWPDRDLNQLPQRICLNLQTVSEKEAREEWGAFQGQLVYLTKKYLVNKPQNQEQVELSRDLFNHFQRTLKSAVLSINKALVEEIVSTLENNEFFRAHVKPDQITKGYYNFGSRLARFIQADSLIGCFPSYEGFDQASAIMDALSVGDVVRADELTRIASQNNLHAPFIYGGQQDPLLHESNIGAGSATLMPAAILCGDVDYVQLLEQTVAGAQSFDWKQKDAQGNSLLCIAAASGSTQMWDFVVTKMQVPLPQLNDPEYLRLLYASIKGKEVDHFRKLFAPFMADSEHLSERCGLLIVDLYTKALRLGAPKIIHYLQSFALLEEELQKEGSSQRFLIASILGSQDQLYQQYGGQWIKEGQKKPEDFQQVYEAILSLPEPSLALFNQVRMFERECLRSERPLPIKCSAQGMVALFKDQDLGKFLINRMEPSELHRMLTQNNECLRAVIADENLLILVLAECQAISKELPQEIAVEAIKLAHLPAIKILIENQVSFIDKLPGSDLSLLSFAISRLNAVFVTGLLSELPPLPTSILAALESYLPQLQTESNQVQCSEILGALARKKLQGVSGAPRDLGLDPPGSRNTGGGLLSRLLGY